MTSPEKLTCFLVFVVQRMGSTSLSHIVIEERDRIEQAISHSLAGLDFADALHLAGYRDCERVASFDDRKFARRAKRLNLKPDIFIPD